MVVIAIVILLLSVSALVRRADNKRTAKQINNVSKRTAKVEKNVINLEVNFEKLAKEQERQAEQLAKHEEQIAKLEHRMSVAEGEIDFQMEQLERLREHIEHAETERDACVFGSSSYFKWDKKCITLEKQIHTAESKLANAEFTAAQAKAKLEVA